MKVEREVIIDLLPAYFSGEASAATRALVEEYFLEHPDFEKTARSANHPLESLKVPVTALDDAKEKLAFERARQITEVRDSMLWMAVCFTLMLMLFRIHDHKIVWIVWGKEPLTGALLAATSLFLWVFYLRARRLKEPMRAHTRFRWMAIFYTLLLFLFKIKDHKIVLVFFNPDPSTGILLSAVAAAMWGAYFYQRWKAKRTELRDSGLL